MKRSTSTSWLDGIEFKLETSETPDKLFRIEVSVIHYNGRVEFINATGERNPDRRIVRSKAQAIMKRYSRKGS